MMRSSQPTRVLVAEDDARTAYVLARLLREDDYEVELVADAEAAIAVLRRDPAPDVVITDLRLPFGGDMAVARVARDIQAELPIVVISGDPEHARKIHRSISPPPTVLEKPLEYARLCAELAQIDAKARP